MSTFYTFPDPITEAYMKGYIKAKQEEGALFSDVALHELATPYLLAVQEEAMNATKRLRAEARDQQWAHEQHVTSLQDTIDRLLANIDSKRVEQMGEVFGYASQE